MAWYDDDVYVRVKQMYKWLSATYELAYDLVVDDVLCPATVVQYQAKVRDLLVQLDDYMIDCHIHN